MQHEIRKYPNRRYYDSTERKHVTLESIRAMILDGQDVRVVDSKTGEDISAAVLTQLILKLDIAKLQLFPSALLHRLIRANGGVVQEFVEKYLNEALELFMDAQTRVEGQVRRSFGLPAAEAQGPGLGSWPQGPWGPMPVNPLAQGWWDWSRAASAATPGSAAEVEVPEEESTGPGAGPDPEVQSLRAELDELKSLVRELQRESSSRPAELTDGG